MQRLGTPSRGGDAGRGEAFAVIFDMLYLSYIYAIFMLYFPNVDKLGYMLYIYIYMLYVCVLYFNVDRLCLHLCTGVCKDMCCYR